MLLATQGSNDHSKTQGPRLSDPTSKQALDAFQDGVLGRVVGVLLAGHLQHRWYWLLSTHLSVNAMLQTATT